MCVDLYWRQCYTSGASLMCNIVSTSALDRRTADGDFSVAFFFDVLPRRVALLTRVMETVEALWQFCVLFSNSIAKFSLRSAWSVLFRRELHDWATGWLYCSSGWPLSGGVTLPSGWTTLLYFPVGPFSEGPHNRATERLPGRSLFGGTTQPDDSTTGLVSSRRGQTAEHLADSRCNNAISLFSGDNQRSCNSVAANNSAYTFAEEALGDLLIFV